MVVTGARQSIAKIIKACQELPGQELIQYLDERGNCRDVTSTDVNHYLREITGKDITAKDFRTWGGRFSRQWLSMNLGASTAPLRPSAIFELRWKRSLRGSATHRRPAANATSVRKC